MSVAQTKKPDHKEAHPEAHHPASANEHEGGAGGSSTTKLEPGKTNAILGGISACPTQHPVQDVNNAAKDYEKAEKKKIELDRRLTEELASVGAGLTHKQQAAYVKAFHEKHDKDYDKEREATKNLDALVKNDAGALVDNAEHPHSAAAAAMARGLRDLAGSSDGATAVKLGAEILEDGAASKALFQGKGGDAMKHAMHQVAAEGLPKMAGELLAQDGGKEPKQETKEKILHVAETFEEGAHTFEKGKEGAHALQQLKAYINGDEKALAKLAEEGARAPGPMEKGIVAMGVALAARDPGADIHSMVKFLDKGADGVKVIAEAERGLSVSSRLLPGVGVLASAFALEQDLAKGGVGGYVSAAGDVLSIAGGALATTGIPIAAEVGEVVDAIGVGVSFLGSAIGGLFGSHPQSPQDEAKGILKDKVHLDDKTAKGLANASPYSSADLKVGEHLNPEQVRHIAAKYPDMMKNPKFIAEAMELGHELHIPHHDFGKMLDEVAHFGGFKQQDPSQILWNGSPSRDDAAEHVLDNYVKLREPKGARAEPVLTPEEQAAQIAEGRSYLRVDKHAKDYKKLEHALHGLEDPPHKHDG